MIIALKLSGGGRGGRRHQKSLFPRLADPKGSGEWEPSSRGMYDDESRSNPSRFFGQDRYQRRVGEARVKKPGMTHPKSLIS